MDSPHENPVGSVLRFIASERGAVGFIWTTVLLLFGIPLLYLCQHHVLLGNLGVGCLTGAAGLTASAVSTLRLSMLFRNGPVGI